MISRRALIPRLALLAAGGAALFAVRDRLPWPAVDVRFANGRDTPWQRLPVGSGLIQIPVSVSGTPVRAVVDSGAQFSAIDRGLAERLGFPRTLAAPIMAYGVSGKPSLTHTVTFDLALPGLSIPRLRAAALDLQALSVATGRDFQLLIGRDVLRRLVVEADFPTDRARFLTRETYHPPRDALVIPLHSRAGAPVASIQIEAAKPIEVLVDTGASGHLALSEQVARETGLLSRPMTTAHSVSLGGLSLDRRVVADRVTIGPLSLRDVGVQIYTPAANAPIPGGLMGAGIFRQFRMALDLGGDRLFLTRSGLMIVPAPREPRP